MKKIIFLFIVTVLFSFQSLAGIQSASNIADQKLVLNAVDKQSKKQALVLINLKTMTQKKLSLPKNLENTEVVGLALFENNLVMISQWTAGGGKNPKIHHYSLKTKKWDQAKEVDCLSFDTVEIKKSTLKLHCEGKSAKLVELAFKAPASVKLVFPIVGDKKPGVQFKLVGGSMFDWRFLEIQKGKRPKRLFKADGFLKNKKSKKK